MESILKEGLAEEVWSTQYSRKEVLVARTGDDGSVVAHSEPDLC